MLMEQGRHDKNADFVESAKRDLACVVDEIRGFSEHHGRLKAIVESVDTTWGGFSLRLVEYKGENERLYVPSLACGLLNKRVRLGFVDSDFEVWGRVVKVDTGTMKMAVAIEKVSDPDAWRKLCENDIKNAAVS